MMYTYFIGISIDLTNNKTYKDKLLSELNKSSLTCVEYDDSGKLWLHVKDKYFKSTKYYAKLDINSTIFISLKHYQLKRMVNDILRLPKMLYDCLNDDFGYHIVNHD